MAQGVNLLAASDDIDVMSAVVGAMGEEDMEDAMELAAISGQLAVASDVVWSLAMPVLAGFLERQGDRLREIAVDQMFQFGASQALSEAMAETGADVGELGAGEVDEGLTRLVVSEAAAIRSAELAGAGTMMAAEGMAELAAAEAMREASVELAEEGIAEVAEGAAELGASEALDATAEALEAKAKSEEG